MGDGRVVRVYRPLGRCGAGSDVPRDAKPENNEGQPSPRNALDSLSVQGLSYWTEGGLFWLLGVLPVIERCLSAGQDTGRLLRGAEHWRCFRGAGRRLRPGTFLGHVVSSTSVAFVVDSPILSLFRCDVSVGAQVRLPNGIRSNAVRFGALGHGGGSGGRGALNRRAL